MKILVTGGNGFIGKHIVNELSERSIEVISFDIVPPSGCLPGVHYVGGTIMDKESLRICMKGCDGVFHLAAVLGVKRADDDLLRCMSINIQGTVNVLEACILSGVPYILLPSSSEIFGDINNKEKISEDSQFNPKSGYAVSKLAGEHFVKGYHKDYGLGYNLIRFFNIYGPGQVAEFVIPRFIKMAQNGLAPTVYGDGNQVRSFCHIQDASRAVADIFMNRKLRNQAFNVGNDLEPISMKRLADRVISKLGADIKPRYVPFSESDRLSCREIYYRAPDISKIRKCIGYEPRIALDSGLDDLISNGDIPESWVEPLASL